MKKFELLIILSIIFSSQPALAESSSDYASKARMSWSAFECAVLASFAEKKETDQKRLFELGYNEGKAFIKALIEGKVSKEDRKSQVPVYFLLLLQGPSEDFMLGRVYEFLVNNVHEKISKEITSEIGKMDQELRKSIASRFFNEKNCLLINPDYPNIK